MRGDLSRFGSTIKERAWRAWRAAVPLAEHARQWLMPRRRMVFSAAGIGIAVVALIGFLIGGAGVWLWTSYSTHHDAIAPLLTLSAGVAVAGVALLRHFAQTDADRQRRITESFSKAIEQLGSDKVEVHLGGIYSLERISKESPNDYWTTMESLTAFVRERSRRADYERTSRVSQRAYFLWLEAGRPEGRDDFFWARAVELDEFGETAPTDIASVLTVIRRRSKKSRKREIANEWRLDLSGAILRQATLSEAHLERADLFWAHLEEAHLEEAHLEKATLSEAHLEGAKLWGVHLEGAYLVGAHLEKASLIGAHLHGAILSRTNLKDANLFRAHLEGARLREAHLEGADIAEAHLEGADLDFAHLEGASLREAHLEGASLSWGNLQAADLIGTHLEGANLREVLNLSEAHLMKAFGDASTQLPEGIARPACWPRTTC